MHHDPKLHVFKGFDQHSYKRMEQWLEKNYHLHRLHLSQLLQSINLTNQLLTEFFLWVAELKESLKLYLQYRYVLHEKSLTKKILALFSDVGENEKADFQKKLFSLETQLSVLMAGTKKNIEVLLQDIPDIKIALENLNTILENISRPHYIDLDKSEEEIIASAKTFLKYSPPYSYLQDKLQNIRKNLTRENNSLKEILDLHHFQLINLAKDKSNIFFTEIDPIRLAACESELKRIRKVVDDFKENYKDILDKAA